MFFAAVGLHDLPRAAVAEVHGKPMAAPTKNHVRLVMKAV